MEKNNPSLILNNLYGLLMEINFHRSDEEVISELSNKPDSLVDKQLLYIKRLSAQLKAESNRQKFKAAIEQIRILKEKGLEELKKVLKPEEQVQLQPLFRKFEELSDEDESSILDDQQLLNMIEILQDRIKSNDE